MDDRRQLDRWLARNGLPGPSSTKEERVEYFSRMPAAVKREWEIRKATEDCETLPDYNSTIVERARKRMARIDAMPPDLRRVVYEYSLEVVQEFINCGIRAPSRIKYLIDTVLHNELPNGQNRFKVNKGPNAKQNPINLEPDDDDEYYVPRANRHMANEY